MTGAIATFVPWLISCAVVNVCCTRCDTFKPEVEDVYEKVIVNSGFASIRANSLLVENSARRENALLVVISGCQNNLKFAGVELNQSIANLAYNEFGCMYPEMRRTCDELDAFMGNPVRKVKNSKGVVMFLYPNVVKIQLDSIQLIAQEVRKAIYFQILNVKKVNAEAKLLQKRKNILYKMIMGGRKWKRTLLDAVFEQCEVCERVCKMRARAEELSVAGLR